MSNNLNLDQATIEQYQEEAKKLGEDGVKEQLQKCIDFYRTLLEEAKRSDEADKAAAETEKALIMGDVYPELRKYETHLEELYSTYNTIDRPTEI